MVFVLLESNSISFDSCTCLSEEPYAAAVAQGNQELLNTVDFAIRQFKESGAWAQSYAQYFPGQTISNPP